MLDSIWGPHMIDRFASENTTQIPKYNPLYWDRTTPGVDALAQQDWGNENNYVNPPFGMISKVLQKIVKTGATATIIAPRWQAQPWFQTLKRLSICHPIRLPNSPRLMLARTPTAEPLKNQKVENVSLEGVWKNNLRNRRWSAPAIPAFIHQ